MTETGVEIAVARLDKIHPVVSGNKFFKLHYFLEQALASKHQTILTFGGAYSNHLVATAFACQTSGLRSIGIVRGDEPEINSHTIIECIQSGMRIEKVSREDYRILQSPEKREWLIQKYGPHTLVPEGGYHPSGTKGAGIISDLINWQEFDFICTPVGTATTLAGLLLGTTSRMIAVPALKGLSDIRDRLAYLIGNDPGERLELWEDYHFGGYAKKNIELIDFMNQFFDITKIPTDFVYTGKMLFGVFDKIKKGRFPRGSRLLCLHTGGLQGNRSLPANTLHF